MLKRLFGAFSAAVLAFSAVSAMPQQPAQALSNYDITVLGDAIPLGSGLSAEEYAFGDYLRDSLTASSMNVYAEKHNTTEKLLNTVKSGGLDSRLAASEVTIVSIGAYDMLSALYAFLNKQMNVSDTSFIDYLVRLAGEGESAAFSKMAELNTAMRAPRRQAIANVKELASELKSRTGGKVVFLTLYNPFEARSLVYQGKDYTEYYDYFQNIVRGQINTYFNGDLKTIEGIETADVYSAFAKNGWNYIHSNSTAMDQEDILPNALGQARIAAVLLDQLGYKDAKHARFDEVLRAEKKTKPFYLPVASRETLYRHAGRTPLTEAQIGDVSMDGRIDSRDANFVLIYYNMTAVLQLDDDELGSYAMTQAQKYRADTNGNDSIAADDASIILRYFNFNDILDLGLSWDASFLA